MFSTSLNVKLTLDGAASCTPTGAASTATGGKFETSSDSSSDHVIAKAASSADEMGPVGSDVAGTEVVEPDVAGTGVAGTTVAGTEVAGTVAAEMGLAGAGATGLVRDEDGTDDAGRDAAGSADAIGR